VRPARERGADAQPQGTRGDLLTPYLNLGIPALVAKPPPGRLASPKKARSGPTVTRTFRHFTGTQGADGPNQPAGGSPPQDRDGAREQQYRRCLLQPIDERRINRGRPKTDSSAVGQNVRAYLID
jgi:hypothetical protein